MPEDFDLLDMVRQDYAALRKQEGQNDAAIEVCDDQQPTRRKAYDFDGGGSGLFLKSNVGTSQGGTAHVDIFEDATGPAGLEYAPHDAPSPGVGLGVGLGADLGLAPHRPGADEHTDFRKPHDVELEKLVRGETTKQVAALGVGASALAPKTLPPSGQKPSEPSDWNAITVPPLDGTLTDDPEGAAGTLPKIGSEREKPILVADDGFKISILDEDKRIGGHIYSEHVGKSDDYLKDRLRTDPKLKDEPAAGTYQSHDAADKLTNATLSQNSALVRDVISGKKKSLRIFGAFSAPTGTEAYRTGANSQPAMRATYRTLVVIRHNPNSPHGFDVITSFPTNKK